MGKVSVQLKYHMLHQEYNLFESQGFLQFSFTSFYLLCAALISVQTAPSKLQQHCHCNLFRQTDGVLLNPPDCLINRDSRMVQPLLARGKKNPALILKQRDAALFMTTLTSDKGNFWKSCLDFSFFHLGGPLSSLFFSWFHSGPLIVSP